MLHLVHIYNIKIKNVFLRLYFFRLVLGLKLHCEVGTEISHITPAPIYIFPF